VGFEIFCRTVLNGFGLFDVCGSKSGLILVLIKIFVVYVQAKDTSATWVHLKFSGGIRLLYLLRNRWGVFSV